MRAGPRLRANPSSASRFGLRVSALTGRGIDHLSDAIRDRELRDGEVMHLRIPHSKSRVAAKLHDVAIIREQRSTDEGTVYTAWVPGDAVHIFQVFAADNLLKPAKVAG